MTQDHKVFPEGQPISQDQGHAAMLSFLRHVENANDGSLPHGLGGGHVWPLRPGYVGRSPSHVAYELPGDAGSISSIETLSPRPDRPSCANTHRQLRQWSLTSTTKGVFKADPLVDPGETALLEVSFHPWVPQSGSRHPVETGAEARGMDAPHRGEGDI